MSVFTVLSNFRFVYRESHEEVMKMNWYTFLGYLRELGKMKLKIEKDSAMAKAKSLLKGNK